MKFVRNLVMVFALSAVLPAYAVAGGHGMKKDIVDVAVSNGSFNTLVAAAKAGGLIETLKSKGPFTVFAPTDAAFAALPKGTVETLLKPENKAKLVAILKHHVLAGAVPSEAIAGKKLSPATVNGTKLNIDATNGVTVAAQRWLSQMSKPAMV